MESYIMRSYLLEPEFEDRETDRTIIVRRLNLTFNGEECRVLNFTDITTYKRLKQEEETSTLLRTINQSVHHEMLGPLKTNVEIAEQLSALCSKYNLKKLKEMTQIIFISSKGLLLHANDLLDQRIIQNGRFAPAYTHGSVTHAIHEIVRLVEFTLVRKKITIKCDASSYISHIYPLLQFDRRRLQQVLFNLLSNAAKFSKKTGLIKVHAEIQLEDV